MRNRNQAPQAETGKAILVKAGKNVSQAPTGAWLGDVREHDISAIKGMTLAEYGRMDKRVLNAQQKTFWDSAVIKPAVDLTNAHIKQLFLQGSKDSDSIWNEPATAIVKKGEIMTNMQKNGTFPEGTLTILKRIEVDLTIHSSAATSYTNVGFINNATAVAVATHDPSLVFHALKSQIMLSLYRGANKQLICEGLLEEFPISCSATGAGSNSFFIQNGPGVVNDEKLMFPEVFEGGEDFWVELRPLNDALRIPVAAVVVVKLKTTQVFTVYR
jgi:hypothetical protein